MSHPYYKVLKGLVALAALTLVSGCSTAILSLESTPSDAEIWATPMARGAPKRIGVTPLTIGADELQKQVGSTGPVFIEFRKERYNSSRALVTDLNATDLKLKLELPISSGLEDQDHVNVWVDLLFESQRLALAGRLNDALAKTKQIQKDSPQLAGAFEIEGGIYFLQKKFREALDSYRTAARINPKNPETIRMRNLLESKLGVRGGNRAVAAAAAELPAGGGDTGATGNAAAGDAATAATNDNAEPTPEGGN